MADAPQRLTTATFDVAQLVHDHHAVVYRYAYRLSGNGAEAEDLTQQTFLAAQQRIGQLRDPAASRGWLLAIARNAFLKSRRKRQPVCASGIELDMNTLAEDVPPEQTVDTEQLREALAELAEEFRTVLLLFYFEDCSYREIAERLTLPLGTVMSRLSRAKTHLRSRLSQKGSNNLPSTAGNNLPSTAGVHGTSTTGVPLPHTVAPTAKHL